MKTYIVESQVAIAVVGVNDEDEPIVAVRKFLLTQLTNSQDIRKWTTLDGGDQDGIWTNYHGLEGTYTLRTFIV